MGVVTGNWKLATGNWELRRSSVSTDGTPFALWVLAALVLFLAASGLGGGVALLGDPSGRSLSMQPNLLRGTPFPDYTIPGFILITAFGLYPLLVLYGLLRRPWWDWMERRNPFKGQHWAWGGTVVLGAALVIWIFVQVLLIGYVSRLQPFYGILGLIMIRLALSPRVRRHMAPY
jgi:hypothetical protein